MNLVLLEDALTRTLPAGTPAATHLTHTLRLARGDTFWCGVRNGARGLATVRDIAPDGAVSFSVKWEKTVLLPPPISLLVGLSRPQTMKKVFALAAEIGCARLDVFRSEKGESSYAQSSLWKRGDRTLDEILESAAVQTCVPAIPDFALHESLDAAHAARSRNAEKSCGNDEKSSSRALGGRTEFRVALDVYETAQSFAEIAFPPHANVVLAIGSERGWTPAERERLRAGGFVFAHLGERVLRVETAVAVALAVAISKLPDARTPHVPLSAPKKN